MHWGQGYFCAGSETGRSGNTLEQLAGVAVEADKSKCVCVCRRDNKLRAHCVPAVTFRDTQETQSYPTLVVHVSNTLALQYQF